MTPEAQRLAIRGNGGQGTNGVKVSKPTCRTNPCGPLARMLPDPCHTSPDTARGVQRKRSVFQSGGVVVVAGTLLGDGTGVSRRRGSGPMPSEASMHQGRWGHHPFRGHPCPHLVRVSARPSEASLNETHGFGAYAKNQCLVSRQFALVARCVCLVNATP